MGNDILRRIEVAESSSSFSRAMEHLTMRIADSFMQAGMSCGSTREFWLNEAVRAQRKLDGAIEGMNALLGGLSAGGEA